MRWEAAVILLGSAGSSVHPSIPNTEETMARARRTRLHISMNLTRVDDQWRHDTIAGIVQLAPTSPLIAIPAIQVSVAALATLGASLKADNDTVAAGRTKLASDIETEVNTRRAVDGELLTLKAAVENKSTKASDLASIGFEERGSLRAEAPIVPPESIDIKLPSRLRGQFTASACEIGKTRWQYAAEWSPDSIGENTWATLPGYGKSRKVTGPSGTKVWVRFARVRGQVQSEWSTPVLGTIP